jgi:hypothetical protein
VENQNSGTVAATAATTILQYDFYNATTHDVTFADDGVTATDHGRPASSPPRPQREALVGSQSAYPWHACTTATARVQGGSGGCSWVRARPKMLVHRSCQ